MTRSAPADVDLSLVAHEVRTPLAIVRIAASMLVNLDDKGLASQPERRRELLDTITRNVDLAMLLMDRMSLAWSVDTGTVDLAKESVDFVSLVREAISDLALAVLRDRDVELVTIGQLPVEADPTAAREIVFNLMSNAAKYSAETAPITVLVDRDGDRARMVVRNHGGGVTPGDTERIFEKFFQAEARSPGVGLGLFVSRGLARAHGGDITVRPAAHDGSEFVLELPALVA